MVEVKEKKSCEKTEVGSVRSVGDRVRYLYFEDEDGQEYGNGTVIGQKDEETAIVEVVLPGRKKGRFVDHLEIPFSELLPHLPEHQE